MAVCGRSGFSGSGSDRKTRFVGMQAELERLIVERPSFHAWPDGTPANWSVEPRVLRFIAAHVKPGMSTLETGAGQTTVAFALAGAHHICITPDQAQVDRI